MASPFLQRGGKMGALVFWCCGLGSVCLGIFQVSRTLSGGHGEVAESTKFFAANFGFSFGWNRLGEGRCYMKFGATPKRLGKNFSARFGGLGPKRRGDIWTSSNYIQTPGNQKTSKYFACWFQTSELNVFLLRAIVTDLACFHGIFTCEVLQVQLYALDCLLAWAKVNVRGSSTGNVSLAPMWRFASNFTDFGISWCFLRASSLFRHENCPRCVRTPTVVSIVPEGFVQAVRTMAAAWKVDRCGRPCGYLWHWNQLLDNTWDRLDDLIWVDSEEFELFTFLAAFFVVQNYI